MELLICGASGRAAAYSAARAGLSPTVVDLFADSDLAALCPVLRIPAHLYPAGLVELAYSLSPSAWIYTGALENHPDVVDAISRRHRLLGNGGAALHAVRDPLNVADVLRRGGLPCPDVRSSPDGVPQDGRWLVKPLASGGGLGIEPLADGVALTPGVYFQERVQGPSFSAVYVARHLRCRLAGVTRQLVGRPGAPYLYTGSVGPWPLGPDVRERIDRLGSLVAGAFGLVGLFGIDFILRDGDPWPVEVNPRYTASVEVLERATGASLLAEHVQAAGESRTVPIPTTAGPDFLSPPPLWGRVREGGAVGMVEPLRLASPLPHPPPQPSSTREVGGKAASHLVVGKAVVYATADCVFPELVRGRPAIADVPAAGTSIRAGEPVLTVFASGRTTGECLARLERRRRLCEGRLRAF